MKQIIPKLGMKREGAGNGNLIIDFEIKFPESLTIEQRETLIRTL
jgi:DnaJ-class molecular chaperone